MPPSALTGHGSGQDVRCCRAVLETLGFSGYYLIRPCEVLIPVRREPVERRVCFDKLSTNGSNIKRPNQ